MVRPVTLREARRQERRPHRTGVAPTWMRHVQPPCLPPLTESAAAAPLFPHVAQALRTEPLVVGGMELLLVVRPTLLQMAGKRHPKARRRRPR